MDLAARRMRLKIQPSAASLVQSRFHAQPIASHRHDRSSHRSGGFAPRAVNEHAKASLIPFEDIPWSEIRDTAVRSLIERYVRERREESFGVYVGDTTTGRVRPLAGND
jgi:hypothetical protein